MNETQVKGRMCGIGGGRPAGEAWMCGVHDGTVPPPAGPVRRGTGFSIPPIRSGHRRSLTTALKMGHCAPAVMAALIDDADHGRESAVLLASAMAGGIGNTGRECGALTSSILYLGDRYRQTTGPDGAALSVALSRRFIDRFRAIHGSTRCDGIRRGGKNPLPCMRAMVSAPEIVGEVIGRGVPREDAEGCGCRASGLLETCRARSFHCVHSVFSGLFGIVPDCGRLTGMTYPFVGGFALTGGTCSAAAAGVLAIGLATGKIENSYGRVFLMMTRMATGGDMMAEDNNNFNAAINRGQILMEWFEATYGTASCAGLTGIDFEEPEAAERYFAGGGIDRCEAVAAAVAAKARKIIVGAKQ